MKLVIELDIPFDSDSAKERKDIERQIKQWVRDTIEGELSFIPFYQTEDGFTVENSTQRVKMKVRNA